VRTIRAFHVIILVALTSAACSADDAAPDALVAEASSGPSGKADDPAWTLSGTFHVGEAQTDLSFEPGSRRIFEFFVGGSDDEPIDLVFRGHSDQAPVRVGILGPLKADGTRESIAWDGYDAATHEPVVHATLAGYGQYLLAVSTHDMAYEAWDVSVEAECEGGACDLARAVEAPLLGGLIETRTPTFHLNPWLGEQTVEVYRREAGRYGDLVLIDRTRAVDPGTGASATVRIPDDVPEGSTIVVKVVSVADPSRLYDDGVEYTLWTSGAAGLDEYSPIGMSDHGDVFYASGVAAFWEGSASIVLRNETRDDDLGTAWVGMSLPGHEAAGLTSFEAEITVDWSTGVQIGDVLSIGHGIEGIGGYEAWACFSLCPGMLGGIDQPGCSSELHACP
jgi:hypothetical protein